VVNVLVTVLGRREGAARESAGIGEVQWVLRHRNPMAVDFLRKPGGSTAAPMNDYDGLAAQSGEGKRGKRRGG
jgi:hypothetical protein